MNIRPITPQGPRRVEWEGHVINALADRLGCSHSDAQGIADLHADLIDAQWARHYLPAQCAAAIDRASTPPDPGKQPAPDAARELLVRLVAWNNNPNGNGLDLATMCDDAAAILEHGNTGARHTNAGA